MGKPVYIIAEAGVNHNGSIEFAKKLIDEAVDAGVDAVKFQSFKAEKLVVKEAKMADYQMKNTGEEGSQYDMLKRLELSEEEHSILFEYCNKKGIDFLSTPFDSDSLKMLIDKFNIPVVKVSSGDLTNSPFLLEIAQLNKDVIISTGMSEIYEIKEALSVLAFGYLNMINPSRENFDKAYQQEKAQNLLKEKVTILHCTTEYPTPMEEVNLNCIKTLRERFGLNIGYSDHTMGIHIPVAAVALGSCLIEKHFTLDRNMEGPDHKASLTPSELKDMVIQIRQVERAMGVFEKKPTRSELKNKAVARKSIVAAKDIKQGETFSSENLDFKRPEVGIRPIDYWSLIGKEATRDYKTNEMIEL